MPFYFARLNFCCKNLSFFLFLFHLNIYSASKFNFFHASWKGTFHKYCFWYMHLWINVTWYNIDSGGIFAQISFLQNIWNGKAKLATKRKYKLTFSKEIVIKTNPEIIFDKCEAVSISIFFHIRSVGKSRRR